MEQEGLRVQIYHRYWSSVLCSFWIIFLVLVTAAACVGHLAPQQVRQLSLCLESSSPAAQANDRPVLFTNGGTFPLPREPWRSLCPPATLKTAHGVMLGFESARLSPASASQPSTLHCNTCLVLRL